MHFSSKLFEQTPMPPPILSFLVFYLLYLCYFLIWPFILQSRFASSLSIPLPLPLFRSFPKFLLHFHFPSTTSTLPSDRHIQRPPFNFSHGFHPTNLQAKRTGLPIRHQETNRLQGKRRIKLFLNVRQPPQPRQSHVSKRQLDRPPFPGR